MARPPRKRPMSGAEIFFSIMLGALIAAFALAVAIVPVWPQDYPGNPPVHHHSKGDIVGARGQFYETWMRPDNRNLSCCNKDDCDYAEAKFENGHWYARHVGETGEMTRVPDGAVETERDAPDGSAHLCKRSSWPSATVYCFIAPAGG